MFGPKTLIPTLKHNFAPSTQQGCCLKQEESTTVVTRGKSMTIKQQSQFSWSRFSQGNRTAGQEYLEGYCLKAACFPAQNSSHLKAAVDMLPVSAEEIKCAAPCCQGQATEPGEFLGEGRGQLSATPLVLEQLSIRAFSCAQSLSISTGSPPQSSRAMFFLGYGFVVVPLPGNSQPPAGSAPVPYIHSLLN